MKKTVYDIITDRIIDLLGAGEVPWQKPWVGGPISLPKNLHSGKPYRGLNTFLLHAMPYTSPYWLTFNQALQRGGSVRKGEKSTPVVFWKWLDPDEQQKAEGRKRIPMLRYYAVFNVEQCDGIEFPKPNLPTYEFSPIEQADRIVQSMPQKPAITHGGNSASYSPGLDLVRMPEPTQFKHPEGYYDTIFHELTHATGHESRLNRPGVARKDKHSQFGSDPYAQEELVAEMGAAFLCGHVGIAHRTIDNSAAYIQSWLKVLKGDSKLVVHAAAQAQKAADFILGVNPRAEEEAVCGE